MYGLIGKKLQHSFSKIIHEKLANYQYDLIELDENQLDDFFTQKKFNAINVTIPYKETVMKYLDVIDDNAKKINCVNTIINKNGKLYGYNTDYLGLKEMLNHFNIKVENQNCYILGTGGTSKTAKAVLSDLNAKSITFVSRNANDKSISYEQFYSQRNECDVIVNTTPVGMYPNNDQSIVNIKEFEHLKCVVDVIYNPLNTNLILDAKEKKIKCCSGLYMLIAQAFFASELFLGKKLNRQLINDLYEEITYKKSNIVLIGMPTSGKTSVGKLLSSKINKKFVDSDEIIESKINCDIKTFFKDYGEQKFREIEAEVIKEISAMNSLVIATGGGVILNPKNIQNLKQNGFVIFLNRDIHNLIATSNRPLSSSIDQLKKLYNERIDLYKKYADLSINGNGTIDEVVSIIIGGINHEKNINS